MEVNGTMQADRKKELKQQYQQVEVQAGVYQIRNTLNQKVLVASTRNLKTLNGKQFQLNNNSFINRQLQDEWNRYGAEAFVIEVLEVLPKKQEGFFDEKGELKKLEEKWIAQIQPFGERGYN
jgi:hypothetical protein